VIAAPASPCTGVCTVELAPGDPLADVCRGCGRTLDEIAAWFSATPAQKLAILATAEQRRVGLASPMSKG
jgi:predicted Fe-S protein YdhL (DUF1289 family)